jgi:hypothetical protein
MPRILRRPLVISKDKGFWHVQRLVPKTAHRAYEDAAFFLFRD